MDLPVHIFLELEYPREKLLEASSTRIQFLRILAHLSDGLFSTILLVIIILFCNVYVLQTVEYW